MSELKEIKVSFDVAREIGRLALHKLTAWVGLHVDHYTFQLDSNRYCLYFSVSNDREGRTLEFAYDFGATVDPFAEVGRIVDECRYSLSLPTGT